MFSYLPLPPSNLFKLSSFGFFSCSFLNRNFLLRPVHMKSPATAATVTPPAVAIMTLDVHADDPASEVFPLAQLLQSAAASCKVVLVAASARYVFAAQDEQVAIPVAAAYFPAPQIVQSKILSWDAAIVAALVRYLPTTQAVQDVEAELLVHFPAAQMVHAAVPVADV